MRFIALTPPHPVLRRHLQPPDRLLDIVPDPGQYLGDPGIFMTSWLAACSRQRRHKGAVSSAHCPAGGHVRYRGHERPEQELPHILGEGGLEQRTGC